MWWAIFAAAGIGYLIGSVQFGLIIGRITRGIDIRDYGSGATGATNVIRTSGAKAGVLVILLDAGKGVAAAYIGLGLAHLAGVSGTDDRAWAMAAGGLGAVVGHIWPVFFGFRGGKAVATGAGAAIAMNPAATAALIPIAALVVLGVRIMSAMTVAMTILLAIVFIALAAFGVSPWAFAAYAVAGGALIVWKHRSNIGRLLEGSEPKIGRGGERRAEPAPTTPRPAR